MVGAGDRFALWFSGEVLTAFGGSRWRHIRLLGSAGSLRGCLYLTLTVGAKVRHAALCRAPSQVSARRGLLSETFATHPRLGRH